MLIEYNADEDPNETGVYACRVPDERMPEPWKKDIFLMWHGGKWWYLGSDQRYRGDVLGWVGPLARHVGPQKRSRYATRRT